MGKTDKYIIPIYNSMVKPYRNRKTAFFGAIPGDKLASKFNGADFYDIQIGNWDINGEYPEDKYELIVCTRASGFARDPQKMLSRFHKCLTDDGILFIDWGMGSDHWSRDCSGWTWGWVKNGHRCYGSYKGKKYLLYGSCITNSAMQSKAYSRVCNYARSVYGAKKWDRVISKEFGSCLVTQDKIDKKYILINEKTWTPININGRSQLYIIHILEKK